MKLVIAAVGHLKRSPEKELFDEYMQRITKIGKQSGISRVDCVEVPESRANTGDERRRNEAMALTARISEKNTIVIFDENGVDMSSRTFAKKLNSIIETGTQCCTYIIGGPDGLDPYWKEEARDIVSFGKLTIPHRLVRILVAEQLYRACTILTNHPYHRD